MALPQTPSSVFIERRSKLRSLVKTPALIAAGEPQPRQYRANTYPFRARSHFLYLVGKHIPAALLVLGREGSTLFVEPEAEGDALWHGPKPSLEELRASLGIEEVKPLSDLDAMLKSLGEPVAALPTEDPKSSAFLAEKLGRPFAVSGGDKLVEASADAALAEAMIALRIVHDEAAKEQLRAAAQASARAHIAGMRATLPGSNEAVVAAAMLASLRSEGLEDAYGPIVSVRGEILHNEEHHSPIHAGDLLLADVGGETPEGFAGDITRTWPVSGTYSPSQREIYDVVLSAQKACVDMVRPGTSYRQIHEKAKRLIVSGLCDLGIFQGDIDGLLERGAAALFFPHGIGHLIGLDVHDMEDLGDRAGYAKGRARSKAFGDCYLRLDRELVPGMAVTIEPGFYQVPAILGSARFTEALGQDFRRDKLARYADVRGIRIEDDVLCTDGEPEVLTRLVPKDASEIEALMRG